MKHYLNLVVVAFLLPASSVMSAEQLTEQQQAAVASWIVANANDRPAADSLNLPSGMAEDEAAETLQTIWEIYRDKTFDEEVGTLPLSIDDLEPNAVEGALGMRAGKLSLPNEMVMRYLVLRKERSQRSTSNRALFICTHGSGPTPQEWKAQIQLAMRRYQPEGIYFVPRMPERSGKRWIRGHNQDAYERVIAHAIAHWDIDPNRVYFLGISQGGFATDKLLPFMPDRFAAGNAMASGVNPEKHRPENLRNAAYRTDVGENDTMFNRVGNAIKFHQRLDELNAADPDGYVHSIAIQKGKGHGIDYRPGVTWIAKHTRNPWPSKLVWHSREFQDRRRDRHYWIQIEGEINADTTILTANAARDSNTITVTAQQLAKQIKNQSDPVEAKPLSGVALRVMLHDSLLDLDRPIKVVCNGKTVFEGEVERSAATQLETLIDYGDPAMTASADVRFSLE